MVSERNRNDKLLDTLCECGGETGKLLKERNWSTEPCGDIMDWPSEVQTALLLSSTTTLFPTTILYGDDFNMWYNDAYITILGDKHPNSLGLPMREVFSEIWDQLEESIQSVKRTKKSVHFSNQLMLIKQNGILSEGYFTFCYSPIIVNGDQVVGVYGVISPGSDGMIQLRRFQALQKMHIATRTVQGALENSMNGIKQNDTDIPFAYLYMFDAAKDTLNLKKSSGFSEGCTDFPLVIFPPENTTYEVDELSAKLQKAIGKIAFDGIFEIISLEEYKLPPCGRWNEIPDECAVLPIASQDSPVGVLVVGLNNHRIVDQSYREFLNLLANQVGEALANATAYEKERERSEKLAEVDRAKTTFFHNISHEFRTPLTLMLAPLEELMTNFNENSSKSNHLVKLIMKG